MQKIKNKKQNTEPKNGKAIEPWYVNPDPFDETIAELLQNPVTRKSFIQASLKEGVQPNQIKQQLQYFRVYKKKPCK